MELQLGTLVVASNVPANSACEPGGYGYLNFFDTSSGFPPPGTTTAQARYNVTGLTVGLSIVKLPDGTGGRLPPEAHRRAARQGSGADRRGRTHRQARHVEGTRAVTAISRRPAHDLRVRRGPFRFWQSLAAHDRRPMYASARLLDLHLRPVIARLGGALAASIALHAAAVLTFAVAPTGTLSGEGDRTSAPLRARLGQAQVAVAAPVPAPTSRTPNEMARDTTPAAPAAASAAHVSTAAPTEVVEQAFGIVPEVVYFAAAELDVRPRPTVQIDPAYPRVAPTDGGYLVLELLIDETGSVDRVNVAVAEPEGFFEQTAIDAFAAARFTPGRRNGVAVKSRTWVELRFHPLVPGGVAAAPSAEAAPR